MKSLFLSAFLIFFVTCSGIIPAAAQDEYPVGKVVALKGSASYGLNGPDMQKNDSIYMNTVVSTGDNSRIIILLIDDTEISLGSNSEFTIDQFVFDPYDSQENRARFGFARGVFRYISGMLEKRDDPNVELETPYGTIGIRGTVVWGGEIGDAYGIYVAEGKAAVALPDEIVYLPAGTGIFIDKATKKHGAVNAWPPEKLEIAHEKIAMAEAEDVGIRMMIEKEMVRNIPRRDDYRKLMWPYKEKPYIEPETDGGTPYSDEFLRLRESSRNGLRKNSY